MISGEWSGVEGMLEIADQAGIQVAGAGIVIEKSSNPAARNCGTGVQVESVTDQVIG